jgi:hypothetical protein
MAPRALPVGIALLSISIALALSWNKCPEGSGGEVPSASPGRGGHEGIHEPLTSTLDSGVGEGEANEPSSRLLRDASPKGIHLHLLTEGLPVSGVGVRAIKKSEDLLGRLKEGRLRGPWVWEDSVLEALENQARGIVLSEAAASGSHEVALLIEAPGFEPVAIDSPPAGSEVKVKLLPVEPISLQVVSISGEPIPNASCYLRGGRYFPAWSESEWVDRLVRVGYGTMQVSDENGWVTFPISYRGGNNTLQVVPPFPFASATVEEQSPGAQVVVECGPAFSIEGVVRNLETGEPIERAAVGFTVGGGDDSITVYSYLTGSDGYFVAENLPASVGLLTLGSTAQGYAETIQYIYSPEPATSIRRDIHLRPTEALEASLYSAWGQPIRSMPLELWGRRFGWTSPRYMTGGEGELRVSSGLAEGKSYGMTLYLTPDIWLQVDQSISTDTKDFIVPGLARIESVSLPPNISAEGGELSWSPLSPDHRGVATWTVGEPSPLLPAGSGMLGWTAPTGGTVRQLAILEEKPDNKLHLAEVESSIRFTWAGPESATLTLLDGQGIFVVDAQTIAPGGHEIPCWVGRFELILSTDAGQRTIKPITAPAGGIDLGALTGVDTASVHGVVLGPDRRPLPDIYVDLLTPDGSFAHTAASMEDGSFHLTGIPAGEFILAATGDSTYGPDLLETRRALFIRPGESLGPFELVLPIGQEGLVGKVLPIPPAKTAAWLIHGDELVKDEVEFDGSFHLLSPPRATTVGISRLRTGQILVASTEVPAGARQVALTYPTGEHRLHLLQPSGEPLLDVNIQAFLHGHVLPYQAMPDGEGGLRIQVDADRDLVLQFLLPDGRVEILPIADVLGRSTLTLPSSEAKHRLQVLDEDGDPLPLAVAMRYGIGDRFQADHEGFLHVGDTNDDHPYAIEAPGYLGQWWWPGDAEEVKLEALVERATIEVPGRVEQRTVATLLVTPLGLGERSTYPEARMLRVPVEGGTLPLPRLPVGTHRFELLDAKGAVIQAVELPIGHGRALAWPVED